jgi:hypothetical protein
MPLFDGLAHPGQRAAGAVAGDKGVDRPGHLPENFLAGGVLVVGGVEWIFKLARQKIAGVLGGHVQ